MTSGHKYLKAPGLTFLSRNNSSHRKTKDKGCLTSFVDAFAKKFRKSQNSEFFGTLLWVTWGIFTHIKNWFYTHLTADLTCCKWAKSHLGWWRSNGSDQQYSWHLGTGYLPAASQKMTGHTRTFLQILVISLRFSNGLFCLCTRSLTCSNACLFFFFLSIRNLHQY